MKARPEKSYFPQIRLWDDLIGREEQENRRSCVSHSLLSPLTGMGQVKKTSVSTSALSNQSGSSPNSISPRINEAALNFLENWTKEICQQAPEGDPLPTTRETVRNFLRDNPKLEGDRYLAAMMLLCLRKYINLDPDFAKAPFAERLKYAGEMAAKFSGFDSLPH